MQWDYVDQEAQFHRAARWRWSSLVMFIVEFV